MVIKTDTDVFSGFRIYPGKGFRLVRMDSKSFIFFSNKSLHGFMHKFNPRKVTWTQIYRRHHKKGQTEEVVRKRTKKSTKAQRAIVGASLDMIKATREQKPEVRQAARQSALREIKEKKKAQQVAKKSVRAAPVAAKPVQQKGAVNKSKGAKPVVGGKR